MLRQLARLTRPVPVAGPRALTVAVYSQADGQLLDARETGVEGVACVDDAARACGGGGPKNTAGQQSNASPQSTTRAWPNRHALARRIKL